MGSANKTGTDRKARIEEMRRAEQARERRNRVLTIAASVVVVAGLVVGGVVLVRSQDDKGSDTAVAASDSSGKGKFVTGKDGVRTWEGKLARNHVTNAVHSLEHGAVWVTYNADAKKADIDALAAKVKKTPYTLMSPMNDQKDPIMLSAWGHQRTVTGASDPNVDTFFQKFVQGEQTPEPGAACTNGLSK